ncbi:hypothetical protein ACLB2K_060481 [Fragaria x ananassa]
MNTVDEEAKKRKRTVDEEDDGVLLSKLILGQEIRKRKQEKKSKIAEPKKKKAKIEEAEKKTSEIEEEEEDETEKKKSNKFISTWPEMDNFKDVLDEEALNELRNDLFGSIFEGFYEHVKKMSKSSKLKPLETICTNKLPSVFVDDEGSINEQNGSARLKTLHPRIITHKHSLKPANFKFILNLDSRARVMGLEDGVPAFCVIHSISNHAETMALEGGSSSGNPRIAHHEHIPHLAGIPLSLGKSAFQALGFLSVGNTREEVDLDFLSSP